MTDINLLFSIRMLGRDILNLGGTIQESHAQYQGKIHSLFEYFLVTVTPASILPDRERVEPREPTFVICATDQIIDLS